MSHLAQDDDSPRSRPQANGPPQALDGPPLMDSLVSRGLEVGAPGAAADTRAPDGRPRPHQLPFPPRVPPREGGSSLRRVENRTRAAPANNSRRNRAPAVNRQPSSLGPSLGAGPMMTASRVPEGMAMRTTPRLNRLLSF